MTKLTVNFNCLGGVVSLVKLLFAEPLLSCFISLYRCSKPFQIIYIYIYIYIYI